MAIDPDALAGELRSLRRRLGVRDPALLDRLGPQTRRLCGITDADGPATVRWRLSEAIEWLLRDEASEVRLAITAALGLNPEAGHRYLGARQRWLATQLRCHERTARRRIDETIEIVVGLAAEREADQAEAADAWQVQSIRALLRLDGPGAELTEERTVMMTKDNVKEIVTRFSLPRRAGVAGLPHDLEAEVIYGGSIRSRDRLSAEHFWFAIELPDKYDHGEKHEYGIRFRIPPGQPMAPHYALVPLLTVKSLDLRVRFDPARLPMNVWRLDRVPPRMIDNPPPDDDNLLPLDRFGEIHVSFRHLRQGFGYGARWQFSVTPEAGPVR